jgi:preprotein translocase subunit SecF
MNLREAISTFRGHRVPNMNLIGRRRWWFALSGTFIVLSLVGLFVRGLNYSIDFKGGALLTYPERTGITPDDVLATLSRFGLKDSKVEILGGNRVQVRTKSLTVLEAPSTTASTPPSITPSADSPATSPATPSATASSSASAPAATPSPIPTTPPPERTSRADALRAALAEQAGISPDAINEEDVGPTWGSTISRKAFTGLIVFVVLVTLYISFRFEVKMALGALVALAHDLIITAGIYALVGRQVTPETVIAILTILGYSLYDSVVIFDKVKENTESAALVARETYSGVVNMSVNQTFMRSVNTSLVVLLPIGALLLFGGTTLKDFAFALFIGVAAGAYSSIFIAAPVLALFKEREPRYQAIRTRVAQRATRPSLRAVPSRAARSAGEEARELEPVGMTAPGGRTGTSAGGGGTPQRPRPGGSKPGGGKKKKGKPQAKKRRRR